MQTAERIHLEVDQITMMAYELGDMINESLEVIQYLRWKRVVDDSPEIQDVVRKLAKKKQLFAECERFGHYHPDYHRALDEVKAVERELEQFPAVQKFKEAESKLDDLLYEMSRTIAHAVSETILVPSNDPLPKKGGCGSGGACRCG